MQICTIRKIARLFERYSVCVTGSKGSGKDVLFGNVIASRGKSYVSNLDYTADSRYSPLQLADLDMGRNTYDDFLKGTTKPYHHPYRRGDDIYISDVGVYYPAQYCNDLNRKYPAVATYEALSRQVSRNAVHINVQNFNRAWDKLREQCDCYLRCHWCKFFGNVYFMKVTLYDKAESCQARVRPCRIRVPLLASSEARMQARIYRDNFYNQHGEVRDYLVFGINHSKHDSYYFEKLLEVTYGKE